MGQRLTRRARPKFPACWQATMLAATLAVILAAGCLSACAQTTPTGSVEPAVPNIQPSATLLAPQPTALVFPDPTPTQTRTPFQPSPPTAMQPPTATWTPTETPTETPAPTPTPVRLVPAFSHIVIILLENKEFGSVIGNPEMPLFNQWASQYTLLDQHYAIRHPSLPNYLALMGGSTFGVDSNCVDCFIDAPSLPDLLEEAGYTWKGYMEDMPSPCFVGSWGNYVQKHNPFIYFDPIRLNQPRCETSVVPFEELDTDLAGGHLPDFAFITPNQCNNAHDCSLRITDLWLGRVVPYLLAYPAIAQNGLVILTWDEGQGEHTCCGLETGGGRIATVLISPWVQPGFVDSTPYTHYSLLKTIAAAWDLPELGLAADPNTALIQASWRR